MELEKEPKIKAKKRRASKSSRKSSMSSTSSNVHEPSRSGSEKAAVAVSTFRTVAAVAPGETTEEGPLSVHYPIKSHQQRDHTRESRAGGSAGSTSSSGQITLYMRTTTAPICRAPSADGSPQSSYLPPPSDVSAKSRTKRPDNRATLVDREPSTLPGATEAVQAHEQVRAGMRAVIQEEIHLSNKQEAKLEPMQETKASSKSGTKHDEVQVNRERKESAARHAVPGQTDRHHLNTASTGTSHTATQHTSAAAIAPPVVRHTVAVDTGTDTPLDLWAAGGPVPELPFAKAEYTFPEGADAAATAGESAKQPVPKQRTQSVAKVMSLVGGKSGPASAEVGGVLSTEATVLLDVNPWVRFPLLVMNLIIWLIGLTLLLVGAYAYVDTWTQMDIPTHKPS